MRVAIELKVPKRRLLFVVTEAWYFRSHRRGLALAAKAAGWEVHIATRVNGTNDLFLDEGFVVHQLDWSRTNAGLQGGVTAVTPYPFCSGGHQILRFRLSHKVPIAGQLRTAKRDCQQQSRP